MKKVFSKKQKNCCTNEETTNKKTEPMNVKADAKETYISVRTTKAIKQGVVLGAKKKGVKISELLNDFFLKFIEEQGVSMQEVAENQISILDQLEELEE